MCRILLLTSTMGFVSKSCHIKILVAQLLSLVFLLLFVYTRPYRLIFHNIAQLLGMVLPVIGLAYSFAGGWESALRQGGGDTTAAVAHDSLSLVIIHVLLLGFRVLETTDVRKKVDNTFGWSQAHQPHMPGQAGCSALSRAARADASADGTHRTHKPYPTQHNKNKWL